MFIISTKIIQIRSKYNKLEVDSYHRLGKLSVIKRGLSKGYRKDVIKQVIHVKCFYRALLVPIDFIIDIPKISTDYRRSDLLFWNGYFVVICWY